MAIPSNITDLSTTAASNSPAGTEVVGANLDNYLRAIQAIIKQGVSKGTDIASSGSITLPSDGSFFNVTGTNTIASIADSWLGRVASFRFADTLTLTDSASFSLGGDITTGAGDTLVMVNSATGVWTRVAYFDASRDTQADAIQLDANTTQLLTTVQDSDIGVTVLAYDANLQAFVNTFTLPETDGNVSQIMTTSGTGTLRFSDVAPDMLPVLQDHASHVLTVNAAEDGVFWNAGVTFGKSYFMGNN